jgi:hypothetical protein
MPCSTKILNFVFPLSDLLYCSYNHQPINGVVANTSDAYEIVQIINLSNTLNKSQKFTVSYVYYKNKDHIVTLGYINPVTTNSTTMFRTVWTLTEAASAALSLNLFNGIDNNKENLDASETTYVFDNSSGKTLKVTLEVKSGIVTINVYK